jgi:hypothetical protein
MCPWTVSVLDMFWQNQKMSLTCTGQKSTFDLCNKWSNKRNAFFSGNTHRWRIWNTHWMLSDHNKNETTRKWNVDFFFENQDFLKTSRTMLRHNLKCQDSSSRRVKAAVTAWTCPCYSLKSLHWSAPIICIVLQTISGTTFPRKTKLHFQTN